MVFMVESEEKPRKKKKDEEIKIVQPLSREAMAVLAAKDIRRIRK